MKKSEAEKITEAEQGGLAGLILDAQPKLLGGIEGSEPFLDSVRVFARAMGVLSVPLCVTEQVPDKLGSTEESILDVCSGSPVFSKDSFSAFGCPDFEKWIGDGGVDHLLLTGIETPICVYLVGRRCLEAGLDGDRPD